VKPKKEVIRSTRMLPLKGIEVILMGAWLILKPG
jgi:hypothetical protein